MSAQPEVKIRKSLLKSRFLKMYLNLQNSNRYPAEQFSIYAGSTNRIARGVRYYIQEVIVYEKYNPVNYDEDLALLRTINEIVFNNVVQPIPLQTEELPGGRDVIVMGWGRISQSGPSSAILQYTNVTSLSPTDCYSRTGYNYGSLLCLDRPENFGVCNGDSGGGATADGKLVGVASFVLGGCGSHYPDGYVRISTTIDWIKKNIGQGYCVCS